MNEASQKIIDRVRKMLNLANDAGASEGERDNAMRMAHKLMAKHNIDSLQLEKAGTASKEARIEKAFRFYGRPWARNVSYNVGRLFFCSYLFRSHYKSKEADHCFIGRESNVITAGEIAEYVVASIMKEGKRRQRQAYADNDWFRSFCWGAASSVSARVDQLIREATQPDEQIEPSSKSMALVLIDHYKAEQNENKALIELKYPALKKGRHGKAIGSYEGREQGRAFGKTVSLNRQLKGA